MAKTVLITGGTGSIGQEIVRQFAKNEYDVYFQFRTNSEVAEALKEQFLVNPFQFDLQDIPFSKLPKIDILVNNAAINISRSATEDVSDEDWNRTISVNMTAPFQLARHYLPQMVIAEWGRIINISSIYGVRACEGNLPYTVSKHGLSGLTKTVAKEYSCFGITSNEICPGPVESNLMDRIATYAEESEGTSRARYFQEVVDDIPAKRMATPFDVAVIAVFLASEQASYITGSSITVDGGMIA